MPGPLIVQSDRTVLLETDHPQSGEARHELAI
ncbi:MAG: Helicase conserved C-terminal domain, partial [Actinomycetota bacterium]